jgi:hypothetical protein
MFLSSIENVNLESLTASIAANVQRLRVLFRMAVFAIEELIEAWLLLVEETIDIRPYLDHLCLILLMKVDHHFRASVALPEIVHGISLTFIGFGLKGCIILEVLVALAHFQLHGL